MKRMLFCFMLSSFSFVMTADKQSDQYQPKFVAPKVYSNQHYTQLQFNRENWHTKSRLFKQRDYLPKTKRRSK